MTGQSKPMRLSPWGSAVAGATGAVLANAMVYPLDLFVNIMIMSPGYFNRGQKKRVDRLICRSW